MRVGEDSWEPVGDLAAWRRWCWGDVSRRGLGEGPALRRGGDVGAIGSEDGFEDVAGFGDVVAVGDHTDDVAFAAACGGDVQTTAGGGR